MASKVVAFDDHAGHENRGPSLVLTSRLSRVIGSTQRRLLALWIVLVFFPWVLQVRSFVQLALPHSISPGLVASDRPRETAELATRCPMTGAFIADVWWNVWSVHYVFSNDEQRDWVCHFVTQQYNIHGAYHFLQATTMAMPSRVVRTLPSDCRSHSTTQRAVEFYYYHGSIGYFSFYTAGQGIFCSSDATGYFTMYSLGSVDMNGETLRLDQGGDGLRRRSYWYTVLGGVWISYRALVLRRSFVLCSQFGRQCDRQYERLRLRGAMVFVQESARLVAHGARNWHRVLLLYLVVEGLMADMFLIITKYGLSVRVQYFSIGYNLSSLLSLIFEMAETTELLPERSRNMARRLFLNLEAGYLGELCCMLFFLPLLKSMNHSKFRASLRPAEVASYYAWSLVGHGVLVIGLASSIVVVRALVAMFVLRRRFKSKAWRALSAPNCVDQALRGRIKFAMLSGYAWRGERLFYTREMLKAFGLLTTERGDLLVHYEASWWVSLHQVKMVAIARIVTGYHVEPITPSRFAGNVAFCDRILGGELARNDEYGLLEEQEV